MKRIPFHYGIFFHAMIGLMGRKPDLSNCRVIDGYYSFVYVPSPHESEEYFCGKRDTLAGWLDKFEILFSQSRCEFGIFPSRESYAMWSKKKILEIVVQSPVFEK